MTLARRKQPVAGPTYDHFKRACRAALKEMGIMSVRFKISRLTGGLVVVVDTEAPGLKARVLQVSNRINELADEHGIVVSAVPAAAVRLSKAGID